MSETRVPNLLMRALPLVEFMHTHSPTTSPAGCTALHCIGDRYTLYTYTNEMTSKLTIHSLHHRKNKECRFDFFRLSLIGSIVYVSTNILNKTNRLNLALKKSTDFLSGTTEGVAKELCSQVVSSKKTRQYNSLCVYK